MSEGVGFVPSESRVNASVILVPFSYTHKWLQQLPAIKSTFQARRKRRQMRCYQLLGQSLGKARDRKMQRLTIYFVIVWGDEKQE